MRGHLEPDDQHYVDAGELAAWRARDPIAQLRTQLLGSGALTDGEADAIDTRVAARVAAAEDFALASPWPDPAGLADDVYA